MIERFRYAAFISYSSRDEAFARRLHRALERYNVPSTLGQFDVLGGSDAKFFNRISPVFKDREELPSGGLDELLKAALKSSSSLVVVCSPNSAKSDWVEKEILFFEELGRKERIFAIIAAGEPGGAERGSPLDECFPPALRHAARRRAGEPDVAEVIAGDARRGKDGFRNAWLKVVAGIIGVNAGALIDRDRKRRQIQSMQLTAAAIGVALLLSTGLAWVDAQAWRTRLSTVAEETTSAGDVLLAAPFAIAGVPADGTLIAAEGDRADATLIRVGSLRIRLDLGRLASTETGAGFLLSSNGATLITRSPDGTVSYDDLRHGTTRTLGAFGRYVTYQLSANGAALVIGSMGKSATAEWTYFDLAAGLSRSLGALSFNNGVLLNRSGTVLVTQAETGTRRYIDLVRGGGATELAHVRELSLAEDGSVLVTLNDDGTGTLFDLTRKSQRSLGYLGSRVSLHLSKSGAGLVVLNLDKADSLLPDQQPAAVATYFDLRSNRPPQTLGHLDGWFDLSRDGHVMLVTRSDGSLVHVDLDHGISRNLGRPTVYSMSDNGLVVATQAESGRVSYYNFARDERVIGLGTTGGLQTLTLSADGSALVARTTNGAAMYFNLRSGTSRNLGNVGEHNGGNGVGLQLSANGAALVVQGEYDHVALYFDLAHQAPARELGRLNYFELSADGTTLVTVNMDGNAVAYDLTAAAPEHTQGAALSRDVCRTSAAAIRPFPASLRDPLRGAERPTIGEKELFFTLRGRPWHPCDWRGIGAGLEGWKQLIRLVEIRYFGEPDYACEDRDAAATRDAMSISRCARMHEAN